MSDPLPLEAIFFAALEKDSPQERAAYLDRVSDGNPELRRRIEKMLAAQAEAGSFLEHPLTDPMATVDDPIQEKPGTVIGPYKLMEQIGEGGMGLVFVAEQQQPVRRKVALKVIKPGMDTRQVVARFEAERQALALMDHPNIARVFDGGTTDSGRPYFVMELVKGVPITDYCDQNQVSIRERLELFAPVCQAVQHAHQKGIIHRDLKPSNVLVMSHDGTPVVKVIDFGVAKAIGQQLTDKTIYTQFTHMIGTPLYMSPEQAGQSGLDVDTRSDIYSLGVLLYELLTGMTPFDKERLKTVGYDEMRRIIREEEPPRPSTRISTLGQAATTISTQRQSEPKQLSKLIRGELDWIVMKALEKDRNRRYESASAFAADVERYLRDEPVQACPPSVIYRLQKFVRRNKGRLAAAMVLAMAMLVAMSGVGWAIRDRAAQQAEFERKKMDRQARLSAQVDLLLNEVDRLMEAQKWPEALAAAERAEAVLAGGEADETTRLRVQDLLRDLKFIARLDDIWQKRSMVVEGKMNYQGTLDETAEAFRDYGVDIEQLPAATAIARLKRRPALVVRLASALDDWMEVRPRVLPGKDGAGREKLIRVARGLDPHPLRNQLRTCWQQLVTPELQAELRRLVKSVKVQEQEFATLHLLARTLLRANLRDLVTPILQEGRFAHPDNFRANQSLGHHLYEQKDFEGAVRFATAALALHPKSVVAHTNLGNALAEQGKVKEAIACYKRAIAFDPKYAGAHNSLGCRLAEQGQLKEAIACFEKATVLDPKNVEAHSNLGHGLALQGRIQEAIACYNRAIAVNPKYADAHSFLGVALWQQGKKEEAIACFKRAIALDPKSAFAHNSLGLALAKQGQFQEAIACYNRAIELNPKFAEAHSRLGNALLKQGKLEEAVVHIRKAISLQPALTSANQQLNNVAWLLATSKDPKMHNPQKAIELAEQLVKLSPRAGNYWNTLGVARYRGGDWQKAIEALNKSVELRKGGDSFDWFFLAMAHWQLGNKDKAQEYYQRAVKWMEQDKKRTQNAELHRFRAEAEKLMKIESPKPAKK